MAIFNLKKMAGKIGFKNYNKMIEDQTDDMGLEAEVPSKNVNLKMTVKDKDNTVPFETQLEAARQGDSLLKVTEKALDEEKKVYNDKRNEIWDTDITAINIETEKYNQEQLKAFSEAQKNDSETAFWDKYVGVQMEGPITKIDNNISDSASQLQNQPDRFKGKEVKKMVMASLKDADAMLFHLYATASKESRELNDIEKQQVIDINSGKIRLIAQMPSSGIPLGMQPIESPIETNEQFSFDLFEDKETGEGLLCSKEDGKVLKRFPNFEEARVVLKKNGVNFDVQF